MAETMSRVVIVGAGQGGLQAAASLRESGYGGALTVVGDENAPPYQRPPLSKAYLTGDMSEDLLALRPDSFFDRFDIDRRLGDPATAIDRVEAQVQLESGERIAFDHVVLATGARARQLSVPGADLDGVVALRSCADADVLRTMLSTPRRVVVVGGGFVGTEVAAAAVKLGHEVTIVESLPRLLARAVTEDVSTFVTESHLRNGVTVERSASVAALRGTGRQVNGVVLTTGEVLPADVVVVGIGAVPNTELAAEAGLATDNGVIVDGQLKTSDPRISAIGDCAAFPCPHARGHVIRLESIQAAVDHARHVATGLTRTRQPDYAALPWFWTEQYGAKIQMAGIGLPGDETVTQGDVEGGKFSVLRFRNSRLACVESVNCSADHIAARKILSHRDNAVAPLLPSVTSEIDLRAMAKSLVAST